LNVREASLLRPTPDGDRPQGGADHRRKHAIKVLATPGRVAKTDLPS